MSDYLSNADFISSTFYMAFTDNEICFISGCRKEFSPTSNLEIELVSQDEDYFEANPINLFRLIKMTIKYPLLPYGTQLIRALAYAKENAIFSAYINDAEQGRGNRGRISTCFSQLFDRFPPLKVLSLLNEQGILSLLTDFSEEELTRLLAVNEGFLCYGRKTPEEPQSGYEIKVRLFYVLSAYYLIKSEASSYKQWDFHKVASCIEPGLDKEFYQYLLHKICGKVLETTYYYTQLDQMITDTQTLAEAACSTNMSQALSK